jgi:ribosomal protein S18 acetylase RimI-like enzyme
MIRSAVPEDAPEAVPLIVEAIGSIALVLTGTQVLREAILILEQFFREPANRISYENTLVLEDSEATAGPLRKIVGVTVSYDGSVARNLDEPLEKAASLQSGLFDYQIPTEGEPDEFYLDTVSVDPSCQGRGFGRQLIEAVYERGRRSGHNRIGLLVDVVNPAAMRLYERLQFRVDKRRHLAGAEYFHMVRDL